MELNNELRKLEFLKNLIEPEILKLVKDLEVISVPENSKVDIKNVVTTVVNYFKQDTYKPLYYNNCDIKDIDGFNEVMEKNVITTIVNYFKQDTYKPLYYNNCDIKDINGFNEVMEKNVKASRNIINAFKLMFLFYEKIYNENIVIKDNSDIYTHYVIKNSNVVQDFTKKHLLDGSVDDVTLQYIISKLIKQQETNPNNAFYIVYGFVQGYLSQNNIYYDKFKSTILKLVKDNLNNIFHIVQGFVRSYLSKFDINDQILQNIIFELINNNSEKIDNIIDVFIRCCLVEGGNIFDLKLFFIKASKQKDIGIDIIYNFICACVLNKECQLDSENMKYLINFAKDENNKIAYESKIILCGMYVSDYLLKSHNKEINKNLQLSEEFTNLLSEVLDGKIQKIEDLTIKEVKLLFNNLMSIKFNKTKEGVNKNSIETGPFLQIIISLAEKSNINENVTIEKLFNRNNQENIAINNFQNKLNNFGYVEIANDTKIDSVNTFLKIFKLKESDFGQKGFKTFYVDFPKHSITIVVNTSKPYSKFLSDNNNIIEDITMIDSSHGIRTMMDIGMLKFYNLDTQNFIKKIPVNNKKYQKNETCWANACCANTVLLNNCQTFNEIIDEIFYFGKYTLKEEIQNKIILETSEYFLSNVEEIKSENEYKETYNKQYNRTLKTSFDPNKMFNDIFNTYEVQKIYFDELKNRLIQLNKNIKKLEELMINLKDIKNILITLGVKEEELGQQKSIDETKKEKSMYCKELEKLKNDIKRLKNMQKFIFIKSNVNEIYNTNKSLNYLEMATDELFNAIQNSNGKITYP